MLHKLKNRLHKEIAVFRAMPPDSQRFVASITLFGIADVLTYVFTNAYLYRQTQSILAGAAFNLGFSLTLTIGFLSTYYLLKYFSAKQLLAGATLLQALTLFGVFFFTNPSILTITILGALFGLPLGLYWSIRNILYIKLTKDTEREYVEGLRHLGITASQLILPLVAGWFIVFASAIPFLGSQIAYIIVAATSLLIFIVSIFVLAPSSLPNMVLPSWRAKRTTPQWRAFLLVAFLSSTQFVLTISLPEMLVLKYVGNEGVLGTFQVILTILGALALYAIGRKTKPKYRFRILSFSVWPLVVGSLALILHLNLITVVLYLLIMGLCDTLFWFIYFPIMAKAVEWESKYNQEPEYPYVLQHEFILNLGRVLSIIFFFAFVKHFGDQSGLSLIILLGALSQVAMLILARPLLRVYSKDS